MPQHSSPLQPEQTVCRNPATGEVLGYSPLTPVEDLPRIMETARKAQKSWASLPVEDRAKVMLRVRDVIVENAGTLAEVVSRDNGKTRVDALSTEVLPCTMAVGYYAGRAKKFLRDRWTAPGNVLTSNKLSKIIRVPYGVVGVISPWNYPLNLPFPEVVAGLLAGNAVILKVATETQMVGRKIEECFSVAGLPEGVFSYVNIPGRLAGSALLKNGIDKLFFIGSVSVGKHLMREAAETLTPVVLELGGNDAMLICEDADLHRAAAGAVWAGMSNSGQSCAGVERIYVHEAVYDPFLALLKEKVETLRVGHDTDFNVDVGVMTTRRQMETVRQHIADALEKGAVIHAESWRTAGEGVENLVPAMVLTRVDHGMRLMQEETFGPVVGVMKVRDMDEAVALANDSDLGLSGSIWSKNRVLAEKLARQIQAGAIMINDHLMSNGLHETPWGGFKMSGIGRVHGLIGFDEMTQPQVVVHDVLPFVRKNLWWHPHGKRIFDGLMGFIAFLYEKPIARRLRGLWSLLKIVPRYFSTRIS